MLSTLTKTKQAFLEIVLPTAISGLFLFGDVSSNMYDVNEVWRFSSGNTTDDYDNTELSWISLFLAFLSSITMLSVILIYWKNPSLVQQQDHEHSACDHIIDVTAIGAPFAVLAYGGTKPRWDKWIGSNRNAVTIPLSIAPALATGFGYMELHEAHLHAEEGYFSLLSQLSTPAKKAKAIAISLSVLLGHFGQGILDTYAFFKALPKISGSVGLGFKYASIIAVGVLVALIEGNTEMRATLLYELGKSPRKTPHMLSIAILFFASLFNGLMPSMGMINCLEIIYKASTGDDLVHRLNLAARIALLCASFVVFGIASAYTFANVALPAVDAAIDKSIKFANKALISCRSTFLACSRQNDEENPVNINEGSELLQVPDNSRKWWKCC